MGTKVLIVEDETIVAEDLCYVLRFAGFKVTGIARTGLEALEQVRATQPDVVVMDLQLEGKLHGLDVVQRIKRDHRHFPKFIFTTGLPLAKADMMEDVRYRYIKKPYFASEIVTVIRQLTDHVA